MQSHSLVRKVERALLGLAADAEGIVVAVSGGPDSVALLRALVTLRLDQPGPLIVAHLNHQLRGAESDGDEEFVRDLFLLMARDRPGLVLRSERMDVAGQAREERANLESVARRLRYDWLARVARKSSVGWVATGHTADDQAETVLHRLLRGTGLKGLRGIAARRTLATQVRLVRPLLAVTRAEVLEYLQHLGQGYRQDATNLDRSRTRNRIRHELLPLLREHYNPAIVPVLGRLAEQAESAYSNVEQSAAAILKEAERPRAGSLLVFDRAPLATVPRYLVREVFRLVWSRENWSLDGMSFDAWNRLAAVALGETKGIDLPGVRALSRERVVQLEPLP